MSITTIAEHIIFVNCLYTPAIIITKLGGTIRNGGKCRTRTKDAKTVICIQILTSGATGCVAGLRRRLRLGRSGRGGCGGASKDIRLSEMASGNTACANRVAGASKDIFDWFTRTARFVSTYAGTAILIGITPTVLPHRS